MEIKQPVEVEIQMPPVIVGSVVNGTFVVSEEIPPHVVRIKTAIPTKEAP